MGTLWEALANWLRSLVCAGLVFVLSIPATAWSRGRGASTNASLAVGPRPNIVLILTDDQRWDSLWSMPTVQREIVQRGVMLSNAYVVNPLCSPSRASILTGRSSHSTGVYTNALPYGGFNRFDDDSTIATWLHGAGYRTGLIGKYMNSYDVAAHEGYVPPGWDRWVSFARNNGTVYNYDLTVDGRILHYGTAPTDYSTDVLAGYAERFIRNTTRPLFLMFATSSPHSPALPAPGDQSTFHDLAAYRPPSHNESDVSDKPEWLRDTPPLAAARIDAVDDFHVRQYQSLLGVDRAVGGIVRALSDTGRLDNTLLVFMGDNGQLLGEHRLTDKQAAYEESIRVPMAVRFDGRITPGSTDAHLALNIDLAPTFAAAGGAAAPDVEGRDLLPVLQDSATPWRHRFTIEHTPDFSRVPPYCALHAEHAVYVRYATGEEEFYDLSIDPYQLANRAGRPELAERIAGMRRALLRRCAPPPPGWPTSSASAS